ncbi:DsbA family protein [Amycolatopsis samaneae]|uniref:DSBA-like thioredoxin domain-containing protein n=1 Tax=Amycolatopsis samaneae TaxID=664691 RepID=A0ABW5GHF8_9PSEU
MVEQATHPEGARVVIEMWSDLGCPWCYVAKRREEMLGLDVTTVVPELTMAPHTPAMAALLPSHEASMARAHHRARELATTIAENTAAA